MARPASPILTDGELRLMHVLWENEHATVGEVVERLPEREKPAYNTVLTMLRILERKGHVKHRKRGRAFHFYPVVNRGDARQKALRHFVKRFFDDAPDLLVLNILEHEKFSPVVIAQLKRQIAESE